MSNTNDTMPAQPKTFHHFTKLPTELRIRILRLAAAPNFTLLHQRPTFLTDMLPLSTSPAETSQLYSLRYAHGTWNYDSRRSLLGTSRFARQIALEDWKAEIQAFDVGSACRESGWHLVGGVHDGVSGMQSYAEEGKLRLLRIIEKVLEEVRRRLAEAR